jgi:hypothetical protein
VSVNGTLFEAKICTFTLESRHFIFNKCPIYIHDAANAKFSTNSHETDYSVLYFYGNTFVIQVLVSAGFFTRSGISYVKKYENVGLK